MNVIHRANEFAPSGRKVCIAIGVFDGVHLGHQQVIRRAIADAQQHEGVSVVVTFDRHPSAVVAPERNPPLIYPLEKKLELLRSMAVDTTLLIHFDKSFSEISGEEFIHHLVTHFKNIHSVCVGSNFTFGHKRSGNVELLKKLGAELQFTVHGLAAVSLDGERVSSTRIRQAIQSGRLDEASQMLGRAYTLIGKVVEGDKIGRSLGFPTANLDTRGLVVPPNGVYAIHASVDGKTVRGVLNIGFRPTVSTKQVQLRVEAHLLDFSGELYGKDLEITFVGKIREEQKFPSREALQAQIRMDISAAEQLF